MPYLKNYLGYQQSASNVFERIFLPGTVVQVAGIYRCRACGFETVLAGGEFPSERRCEQHAEKWAGAAGEVQWQLVACPINTHG
jgi:hypothetical protein